MGERDDDKASIKATELHNPRLNDRRLLLDDNHDDKATDVITSHIQRQVSE